MDVKTDKTGKTVTIRIQQNENSGLIPLIVSRYEEIIAKYTLLEREFERIQTHKQRISLN